MKTYTFGTTPKNVIEKALPHKYEMSFNKSDMLFLLEMLKDSAFSDISYAEEALSLRSNILETIGIEEI